MSITVVSLAYTIFTSRDQECKKTHLSAQTSQNHHVQIVEDMLEAMVCGQDEMLYTLYDGYHDGKASLIYNSPSSRQSPDFLIPKIQDTYTPVTSDPRDNVCGRLERLNALR